MTYAIAENWSEASEINGQIFIKMEDKETGVNREKFEQRE